MCLVLALRAVPFDEFLGVLRGASFGWLLLTIPLQVGAVWARAVRWRALLDGHPTTKLTFAGHSIGFLFNNVLPFRLGEAARVLVVSERGALPVVHVAASALVERVVDVAFILVAFMAVLPFMQVPQLVSRAAPVFGALVLAALVGLVLVVRYEAWSRRLLAAVLGRLRFLPGAAIQARWGELVEGLTPLTRLRSGSAALLWTVIAWAFSISIYWLTMRAFLPNPTLVEAVFIIVALALAISVPSSPGFVGVYQYIGLQALVLPFGAKYSESAALAVVMTAYMIYYLGTTAFGIAALGFVGQSFANLGRMVLGKGQQPVNREP